MKYCALLLVAAVAYSLPTDIYQTEWNDFKATYGKQYPSSKEESRRYEIFSQNLDIILEHNKLYEEGLSTYKMGINQFSDLTEEEYRNRPGLLTEKLATFTTEDVCQREFESFKEKFDKLYITESEENTRMEIFCKNFEKITQHNKQYELGQTSFKLAINQYADLTAEEFQRLLGSNNMGEEIREFTDDNCQVEFKIFKDNFGKLYSTEEEKLRFDVFCGNFKKIQDHNEEYEKGITTFKMGVNKYTDMTEAEYQKMLGIRRINEDIEKIDDKVCEEEFEIFREKYSKLYSTAKEENHRLGIFCKNLEKIMKHNEDFEKGVTTYKMGVNQYADLTEEEIEKMMGVHIKKQELISLADNDCKTEFESFKDTFEKLYASEKEEQFRLNIFCENLKKIEEHNKQYEESLTTYKMGVNKYTDMTDEEYQKMLGTHRIRENTKKIDDKVCKEEFEIFKDKYSKLYSTEKEENYRFEVFCENLEEIMKHNEAFEQNLTTYRMGVNKYSDFTQEEFQKIFGILHKTYAAESKICGEEFETFKLQFNKLYSTEKEENFRFQIFCKNLNEISEHNEMYKKGLSAFKMGVNKFSDMTKEEFEKYLGTHGMKMGGTKLLAGDSEAGSCENQWAEYKKNFGKVYLSEENDQFHFNIFCKNLEIIRQHNEEFDKGSTTFRMGINKFTDMTEEEIAEFLGYRSRKHDGKTVLLATNHCEEEWEKFKEDFGKTYPLEEEPARLNIFCKNLNEIQKHNKEYDEGKTTFQMSINKFADMTEEEIKQYLGFLGGNKLQNDMLSLFLLTDVCENEWEDFKKTYNKIYSSGEEDNSRFNIFCNNLKMVTKHNENYEKGVTTFKMGLNSFSDMTAEEIRRMLGFLPEAASNLVLMYLPEEVCLVEWRKFKEMFNKRYLTEEEESRRYEIFRENLNKIARHNELYERGQTSFKMGVTEFSDMTTQEYEAFLKRGLVHH